MTKIAEQMVFHKPGFFLGAQLLLQVVQSNAGFLFCLPALLLVPDVSGGAQTYIGVTHTQFGSSYAGFGLVRNYRLSITSPKRA